MPYVIGKNNVRIIRTVAPWWYWASHFAVCQSVTRRSSPPPYWLCNKLYG